MNVDERDRPCGDPVDPKRPYRPPILTEYGSIEELVDSGVVGGLIVPSIMKPPVSL